MSDAAEREFLQQVAKRRSRLGRRARSGWTAARLLVVGVLFASPLLFAHADIDIASPEGLGCAAVAVLAIALAWPGGILDHSRQARRVDVPATPWVVDHAWNPAGETRTPLHRYASSQEACFHAVFLPLWLATQASVLWRGRPTATIGLLLIATAVAVRVWLSTRNGAGHVAFTDFPYRPGGLVVLHFGMAEGGGSFERVVFQLHRVVEERSGWSGGRHCAVTFTRRNVRPPGELPGPNQDVELVFDVPADAGGTRLSAPLPEYWVLDVSGKTSAGWYFDSFLVPIYA